MKDRYYFNNYTCEVLHEDTLYFHFVAMLQLCPEDVSGYYDPEDFERWLENETESGHYFLISDSDKQAVDEILTAH